MWNDKAKGIFMENLTPELLEKARDATSPEELIEIAEMEGYSLDLKNAIIYYEELHPKEINDDDELDGVSGGCSHCNYCEVLTIING